jgi:hypothetical protein
MGSINPNGGTQKKRQEGISRKVCQNDRFNAGQAARVNRGASFESCPICEISNAPCVANGL